MVNDRFVLALQILNRVWTMLRRLRQLKLPTRPVGNSTLDHDNALGVTLVDTGRDFVPDARLLHQSVRQTHQTLKTHHTTAAYSWLHLSHATISYSITGKIHKHLKSTQQPPVHHGPNRRGPRSAWLLQETSYGGRPGLLHRLQHQQQQQQQGPDTTRETKFAHLPHPILFRSP